MNFVDISSWQRGLDLAGLFGANPDLDGVIVKVSQGTGYVNPYAKNWLDWLIQNGKPAGTFHYLDLMGPEAEARHYVESVRPWLGKVALAIDYEEQALSKGTAYLKACLDEVYRLTGVKPLVYCSQVSTLEAQNFTAIADAGYPLWVAQYADMEPVLGFLTSPWHKGSPAPFKAYTVRQYTSCGYLNGWESKLDFDLFYGGSEDWAALYGGTQPVPPATLKPADPAIVSDVMMGYYGIGQERIDKLRAAGYDPNSVQRKINELYGIATRVRPLVAGNVEYLNTIDKIVRRM